MQRWLYASEATVNLTPTAFADRIYLPLASGALIALRASDGQMFWRSEIGGEISAAPVADEDGVYTASTTLETARRTSERHQQQQAGALHSLGREGGVTLWRRTLTAPLRGALALNQTTVFGGSDDGRIYAFRKKTGETLWSAQFPAGFNFRPLLINSHLYAGSEDGNFTALDQATGKVLWRYRTRGAVRGEAVAVDGVVYFGSLDGYVYALGAEDGRLRWRARTGAGVQAVASAENGLLVPSLDNFVYLLSYTRGDRLWKHQLAGRLAAMPLATSDGVLFTPLSGNTGIVLDLRDGRQLNSLPLGEDNSMAAAPIMAANMLLITTRHGLLAFSRAAVSAAHPEAK
ncbi:MAG: PQQ-binding-like beta-propeller repeat protein [Pyrinomonadaceae bacterium]